MTLDLLRLLGTAEFIASGQRQKLPEKGFQLLAFLTLSPLGRSTRRQLADLLWDSADDAVALSNLRQLLLRIRRFPAVDAILEADAVAIWLHPAPLRSDLQEFLKLVESEEPRQVLDALSLFRGDLLEETFEASSGFTQWLAVNRVRLRETFFAAASKALIEMTRFGNAVPEELRMIERRMLPPEPDREASYRALIEAYGRNGMKDDVIRLYGVLENMLQREFHAPVSNETRAVFRRVSASLADPMISKVRQDMDLARVAFLPLKILAPAADNELIHSLFDDVANNLARYRSLTVLAIHSSFRRHDMPEELRNLALKADYHVSGFVLPDGERMSMNMVETATDRIVWAAEYAVTPAQLASTFRMLSQQVAASLADAVEHQRLSESTVDAAPSAYHNYLRGKMLMTNVELPHLRRARMAFQLATQEQFGYAAAHARLAQTLVLEWLLLGGSDPQILVAARNEADLAIAYDGGGPEGHWIRGAVSLYQRDYEATDHHFATAETLGPHSADLLVHYADALSHLGRPREAWERFERALQLNPMPPDHYWWAGASIAFVEERYDAVIDLCAKMDSDEPAIRLLAATHGLLGNTRKAQTFGRRVSETYPGLEPESIGRLVPSRNHADVTRFVRGLRLAGVGK